MSLLRTKFVFLDAVGSVRTEVTSQPMFQNFPMKMQKGGIEYLAAVTRSGLEFQETNSEVVSRPMFQNFPMKMQKGGIEYLAAVTRSGLEFQETNSEVVSRPMFQNLPMKMQKGGIEYLAAVARSGQEFQETNSEVCVTIPRQGRAILWQKIYTEFSQFKGIVPEEECMIGPVVELHTSNPSNLPSKNMQFKIRIPHCLKKDEQLASIKVRTGDVYTNIPFIELRKNQDSMMECSIMKWKRDSSLSTRPISVSSLTQPAKKHAVPTLWPIRLGL